jgi:hypothetical protein
LLSAVNSSGAVSPVMRANCQQDAGNDARARGAIGDRRIMYARGKPIDAAASRSVSAPAVSMSSVVRTTTGMTITASATAPAHPEKWPIGATMTS